VRGFLRALGMLAVLTCTACGGASSTSTTSTTISRVVPTRWRTYSYATGLISVPAGWTVLRDSSCIGDVSATNVLYLGEGRGDPTCGPPRGSPLNSVLVTRSDGMAGTGQACVSLPHVNGLPVINAGPCDESRNAAGIFGWYFPTLDISVDARGPEVHAVLLTVRRSEDVVVTDSVQG
jgi:hypothetical protein